MDLLLRRGEGAFIFEGVLLPYDEFLYAVHGGIDFTPRSTAQRKMLTVYNPDAATTPLDLRAFGQEVLVDSADGIAQFHVTINKPRLQSGSVVIDYAVSGSAPVGEYGVRVYTGLEALRGVGGDPHGRNGSVVDINFAGPTTTGFVPTPDPAYVDDYFIVLHVYKVSSGLAGPDIEIGGSLAGTRITGAVIFSQFTNF